VRDCFNAVSCAQVDSLERLFWMNSVTSGEFLGVET
jgi:hypothetical protein